MNEILFHYKKVDPTTWVYLSSLLTIGLYFKFNRLWSIRNIDLIGLILLAPGLLMAVSGSTQVQPVGYIWLFAMGGLFTVRLLLDPSMVRRPLLEPNLSMGGMTFIGLSLLIFLMANVLIGKDARQAEKRAAYGPTYELLRLPASFSTKTTIEHVGGATKENGSDRQDEKDGNKATGKTKLSGEPSKNLISQATSRTMAILSHLAIVIGIVVIGYRHFDNINTGIAVAMLYLLLPYTAQLTGRVDHVLPAALLIWAVEAYRRPMVSGTLMGLAIGLIYYPVFLLPLWCAFYWQRGLVRFSVGVVITLGLLFGALLVSYEGLVPFAQDMQAMFTWDPQNVDGFWSMSFIALPYRIPVMALFVVMCGSFALWPAQKNLGTLLCCSAAVMLGTQFWHVQGGGLFMAWYLPLLLLTIFRPNLEDRVALSVLGEGWLPRRRKESSSNEKAA